MDYNEYRALTNLIDIFLKTKNRQTLATIQNFIETKEGCYEKVINDLVEYNQRYIQVFSTDDQIKILSDLMAQIKQRDYLAYRVSWMLPYVSDRVLKEILSTVDDVTLAKVMYEIKENIRFIGNRFYASSIYFCFPTTSIFPRMCERTIWRMLYRECQINLKK